jgi:hypothetical protein
MTGVNAGDNSAKIYKDCGWDADNHGIAGDWGSAGADGSPTCKFGTFAVSTQIHDHHTHKFLPSTVFNGGNNLQGGATYPSMFCAKTSTGSSDSTNLFVLNGKTYGYGKLDCPGTVKNMQGSYDPWVLKPCPANYSQPFKTDVFSRTCYDWAEKGFDPANGKIKQTYSDFKKDLAKANTASQKYQAFQPYPFGVDPVWRTSGQAIAFTNGLKMKMAVILGVIQMTIGILLKWVNFCHRGHYSLVLAVGVPEFLFMTCTFGYLCFMIFIKWGTDYTQSLGGTGPECFSTCTCPWTGYGSSTKAPYGSVTPSPVSRGPPNLVVSMLAMFGIPSFVPGLPAPPTSGKPSCWLWLYEEQLDVQIALLLIIIVSVPWLLFTEPCLVKCEHDKHMKEKESAPAHSIEEHEAMADEEEEFSMSDVFVHQVIHTIEFVLGCVSNTASYLRLWALSLAHSQLSEVFWEYIVLGYGIGLVGVPGTPSSGMWPGLAMGGASGGMMLILCYAIFWCCTMAVLMGMESLSAFLHALRLQWVEFQNKFFSADGHRFTPLSFEMAAAEDE